jgi:hypothetical protein
VDGAVIGGDGGGGNEYSLIDRTREFGEAIGKGKLFGEDGIITVGT